MRGLGVSGILKLKADGVEKWDSGLLVFLFGLEQACRESGITLETGGLPEGIRRILALAARGRQAAGESAHTGPESFRSRWRKRLVTFRDESAETLGFVGECLSASGQLLRGQARMRGSDLMALIAECGPGSLPIVGLIAFLVGMILAFVGALQLSPFGAQIYVANLVGLGMAREMGGMMTALIMTGRIGASYAARLGTMQVNEEIDAFSTLGLQPVAFLALPRLLALFITMPFLCLFADFLGMLGGAVVGIAFLDLETHQYLMQTREAVGLKDLGAGLVKAAIFGLLVGLAGCRKGLSCGRSASAVGDAATGAVVTGIVYIVLSDSLLTMIYSRLGW
ncbi:MAG: ABC transporter permease [Magnetococcales bacterium]|nr:ABC transporter permease [Magnetococcales bacterium]